MLVALLALSLVAAEPASSEVSPPWPADPTRPVIIGDTSWLRRPTPEQLAAALPVAARDAGVGGEVVMNCMVTYDGDMNDCQVVIETPTGLGLGAAAVGLARAFQLNPMIDGQSSTGGRILIPVKFRPPPRP